MDRRAAIGREAACYLTLLVVVGLPLLPVVMGRPPVPDYLGWFRLTADLAAPRTAWNPLWYDALGQYFPWRSLLAEGLRENVLPLWNPWQFSGYAFAGNGQSALFYPPNWLLFGLFSVPVGFCLTAVGHLWLAAAGTFALLRQLGCRRSAALVGGVGFGLSGFMIGWLTLPTLISSASWLPLALALLERGRRTGERRTAGWAGLAVGLSALAGHPQIFYYVALTTLLVAAVRFLPRRWPEFALCGAVAGLIAAPALLPVLDLAPRSHRPPHKSVAGYRAFVGRSVPPDRAVTAFLPRFYGSPERGSCDPAGSASDFLRDAAAGRYWGLDRAKLLSPGDYTELNIFVGLLPLLLALCGLIHGPPAARLYGGLGLLALLLAGGLPLNKPLYFLLPGWSAGAGPCRLAVVWSLGAAVAAGLGLNRLLTDPRRHRRLATGAVAVGALALLLAALARELARRQGLGPVLEVTGYRHLLQLVGLAVTLAGGGWLMARWPRCAPLLVAAELVVAAWGFTPTCDPAALDLVTHRATTLAQDGRRLQILDEPAGWTFTRPPAGLSLPPNLASLGRARDVGGYDSLLPADAKEALWEAAGRRQPCPLINGNMLLLGEVDPRLVRQAVAAVVTPNAPRPQPLPDAPPSRCRAQPEQPTGEWLPPAAFVLDGVNRITLLAPAVNLLLLDSPDPGWRCFVGEPGHVLTPAVWLPSPYPALGRGRLVPLVALPGLERVRVQFVYQPTPVRLGLFLAFLGCLLLAAVSGRGRGTRVIRSAARPSDGPSIG